MNGSTAAVYLVVAVAFGFGTMKLATNKGRAGVEGFLLGFFLGLIGLIIEAVLPKRQTI